MLFVFPLDEIHRRIILSAIPCFRLYEVSIRRILVLFGECGFLQKNVLRFFPPTCVHLRNLWMNHVEPESSRKVSDLKQDIAQGRSDPEGGEKGAVPDGAKTRKAEAPVIVWHSDPVSPGETVLLQGGEFGEDAVLDFARVPDGLKTEEFSPEKWEVVLPLQASSWNLKGVVPSDQAPGIFLCRVRQEGGVSNIVALNAPDPWWVQGGHGEAEACAGGWLRVFGKCLALSGSSRVVLRSGNGEILLPVSEATSYSLTASIPAETPSGLYEVRVHNGCGAGSGWRPAGRVTVRERRVLPSVVLNILDFAADPAGREDCTLPIVRALEHLSALGGGTLYFPRGRYRIVSNLRSGMFLSHPLKIPEGVTLRGESAESVTLWWPERSEPLPTLIEASSDFGMEDLGIVTRGRHRNIVSGESRSRIRRVRIRANCGLSDGPDGPSGPAENPALMGAAFEFWGGDIAITDCDIYHSSVAFGFKNVRGGYVARNVARGGNFVSLNGGRAIIFENNVFVGNQLSSGGNNIALHYGAVSCRHVYYADNDVSHIYGGDHETLTLDGHGTAYLGRVEAANGEFLTLSDPPKLGSNVSRDSLATLHDTTAYILSGQGAGQYRRIVSWDGLRLRLDSPWLLDPGLDSLVSIGCFNGRHLIIGNTARDAGALVQLYPPNCECIVAENKGFHAGGINGTGRLGIDLRHGFHRVEPSWYNQFLDNHVVWGNGWGGGEADVDGWLGGDGCLCLWGSYLLFYFGEDGTHALRLPDLPDMEILKFSDPLPCLPISRCQIVRRHRVDNNHSIRVRGAVVDALIENCVLRDSTRGIRVDREPDTTMPGKSDMLRLERDGVHPHLSPRQVLVRNILTEGVRVPYSGTDLSHATILPIPS